MRPVQLADIEAAARALMCCTPAARSTLAAQLVAHADIAEKYRKRLRKPHLRFGTGTLMSAAAAHPQARRPAVFGADTLDAFAHVIKALEGQKS